MSEIVTVDIIGEGNKDYPYRPDHDNPKKTKNWDWDQLTVDVVIEDGLNDDS